MLKMLNGVTEPQIKRLLRQEVLFINHQTINIMRKFSLVFAAALLLTIGNAFATEGSKEFENPKAKICAQISDLLDDNSFNLQETEELTAFVQFTLNSEREIVVLSVKTQDDRLESFVKARLNYQKVGDLNMVQGKVYQVPIRITA